MYKVTQAKKGYAKHTYSHAKLAAAIVGALASTPFAWAAEVAATPSTTTGVIKDNAPVSTEADKVAELDEIVVPGFRGSLERALDIKRDSAVQTDSIVAQDVAKFPDLNLAESLQRIPGVSITRDAGEGRNISVRGLGAQFTRVRINGMEALATTGGTDSSGGANRGRGFDFNVFAADLFNRLSVQKTSSAETEEGSLGATVDLTVARPFDYNGFTFAASGQMGYNDLSEDTDPRGTLLISNTFADGMFGALVSVAYSQRTLVEEGHSTVRWDNGTSSGGFSATSPYAPARLATTFHPRLPRYGVLGHDQDRLGVTSSLQFNPTASTRFTFDALISRFKAERKESFLEAVSFSRTGAGKPQTIVRDGVVDSRGNLVYGVFDNVDVRSESRYDELETKFDQLTLGFEHDFNDHWHAKANFGHSRSKFDNPIQTTVTVDRANAMNYIYDYRNSDRLPLIQYGFDVNNPASWSFANGLSEIRLRPQGTLNTFDSAGFDIEWNANENFSLKGGLLWKSYEFSSFERRRASETTVPALPVGTSIAALLQSLRFGNGLGLPAGSASTWLQPNFDAFAELFGIYSNSGAFALSDTFPAALGGNTAVAEQDHGAYLQGDFYLDTAIPLRGNFGIRTVETKQRSQGYAVVNSVPRLTVVKRSFTDTLPSLNIVAEVTPDFLVRFGAAKVMARPGLGNLTPGVTVNVSGGSRTVTGGDPNLEPFRAKTADLSLEWYFAEESLLSLALFYKDIETFVQTSRETRPYSSSGLPANLLDGTGASVNDDFQFNVPLNTPGGPLKGFEVGYQQPFTFLPGLWSNFGTQLNYTFVDSKIQYLTAAGANSLRTDLTGLSNTAYSATLYYEADKFGARVTCAWRDDYLTTVPGRNNNDVEGTKATLSVDASLTYKLNDHWEMSLEGLNLTDEFNDQWIDSVGDRSVVNHHTGRQFLLGGRYKF